MFIQGDLQAVFDALYSFGAIDPVLKMDWAEVNQEMVSQPNLLKVAVSEINACQGNRDQMVARLGTLDPQAVKFIALEVAREFAEFTDRKAIH